MLFNSTVEIAEIAFQEPLGYFSSKKAVRLALESLPLLGYEYSLCVNKQQRRRGSQGEDIGLAEQKERKEENAGTAGTSVVVFPTVKSIGLPLLKESRRTVHDEGNVRVTDGAAEPPFFYFPSLEKVTVCDVFGLDFLRHGCRATEWLQSGSVERQYTSTPSKRRPYAKLLRTASVNERSDSVIMDCAADRGSLKDLPYAETTVRPLAHFSYSCRVPSSTRLRSDNEFFFEDSDDTQIVGSSLALAMPAASPLARAIRERGLETCELGGVDLTSTCSPLFVAWSDSSSSGCASQCNTKPMSYKDGRAAGEGSSAGVGEYSDTSMCRGKVTEAGSHTMKSLAAALRINVCSTDNIVSEDGQSQPPRSERGNEKDQENDRCLLQHLKFSSFVSKISLNVLPPRGFLNGMAMPNIDANVNRGDLSDLGADTVPQHVACERATRCIHHEATCSNHPAMERREFDNTERNTVGLGLVTPARPTSNPRDSGSPALYAEEENARRQGSFACAYGITNATVSRLLDSGSATGSASLRKMPSPPSFPLLTKLELHGLVGPIFDLFFKIDVIASQLQHLSLRGVTLETNPYDWLRVPSEAAKTIMRSQQRSRMVGPCHYIPIPASDGDVGRLLLDLILDSSDCTGVQKNEDPRLNKAESKECSPYQPCDLFPKKGAANGSGPNGRISEKEEDTTTVFTNNKSVSNLPQEVIERALEMVQGVPLAALCRQRLRFTICSVEAAAGLGRLLRLGRLKTLFLSHLTITDAALRAIGCPHNARDDESSAKQQSSNLPQRGKGAERVDADISRVNCEESTTVRSRSLSEDIRGAALHRKDAEEDDACGHVVSLEELVFDSVDGFTSEGFVPFISSPFLGLAPRRSSLSYSSCLVCALQNGTVSEGKTEEEEEGRDGTAENGIRPMTGHEGSLLDQTSQRLPFPPQYRHSLRTLEITNTWCFDDACLAAVAHCSVYAVPVEHQQHHHQQSFSQAMDIHNGQSSSSTVYPSEPDQNMISLLSPKRAYEGDSDDHVRPPWLRFSCFTTPITGSGFSFIPSSRALYHWEEMADDDTCKRAPLLSSLSLPLPPHRRVRSSAYTLVSSFKMIDMYQCRFVTSEDVPYKFLSRCPALSVLSVSSTGVDDDAWANLALCASAEGRALNVY